jgi:hypothetical protein
VTLSICQRFESLWPQLCRNLFKCHPSFYLPDGLHFIVHRKSPSITPFLSFSHSSFPLYLIRNIFVHRVKFQVWFSVRHMNSITRSVNLDYVSPILSRFHRYCTYDGWLICLWLYKEFRKEVIVRMGQIR